MTMAAEIKNRCVLCLRARCLAAPPPHGANRQRHCIMPCPRPRPLPCCPSTQGIVWHTACCTACLSPGLGWRSRPCPAPAPPVHGLRTHAHVHTGWRSSPFRRRLAAPLCAQAMASPSMPARAGAADAVLGRSRGGGKVPLRWCKRPGEGSGSGWRKQPTCVHEACGTGLGGGRGCCCCGAVAAQALPCGGAARVAQARSAQHSGPPSSCAMHVHVRRAATRLTLGRLATSRYAMRACFARVQAAAAVQLAAMGELSRFARHGGECAYSCGVWNER